MSGKFQGKPVCSRLGTQHSSGVTFSPEVCGLFSQVSNSKRNGQYPNSLQERGTESVLLTPIRHVTPPVSPALETQ